MNAEQSDRIEALYLQMFDMLLSYARSKLQDDCLAEEAVQEAFRIACQKPEELFGSPNPQGWMVQTLKHTLWNLRRSRESAQQLLERYLATQTTAITFSEDRISLEVLYENVADLEEFKLIKELAVEGRSHLEMAQARNISVSACKKRVQRAKETLEKKLGGKG